MAEEKNKEVKKAVEVLDEMSMSREERERHEAILKAEFNYNTSMYNMRQEGLEEGMKKGITKGKKEGIAEGKKANKIEIAKKLLKKNMDILEIQEITGLTQEEIEQLI